GQRNNKYGYLVTYEVPGSGAFTLFWSRDLIDFRGTSPTYRLNNMPLGEGTLYYPDRLTAQSLPDVYQAVQIIDQDYADEADGASTAMEAFTVIAAGGAGPRVAPKVRGAPPLPGGVPRARAVKGGAAK